MLVKAIPMGESIKQVKLFQNLSISRTFIGLEPPFRCSHNTFIGTQLESPVTFHVGVLNLF